MSNITSSGGTEPLPKRRRLWLWFFVVFLVVFLGLALVYPMSFYNGRSVRDTVLWKYYILEVQQEVNASGNLGPTSDNGAAALTTAGMHVVLSALAGAVGMGIAWASQKGSAAP